MKFRAYVVLAVITCCLLPSRTTPVLSQSQQLQSAPPQQQTVKLNMLVLDSKNNSVTDLRQEDFQVFENDEPQTISSFSKEDVPVSYCLLIDRSGSLNSQFKSVLEAASIIIKSNRPQDETMLVSFISSGKIELIQNFTSDKEVLLNSLKSLETEGGQTAVIDAVHVGVETLGKHRPLEDISQRRRVLIVITDGEERGSAYRKDDLIKLIRKQNVQIFIIGLIGKLDKEAGFIRLSPRDKAITLLEDIAKESGGHVLFESKSDNLQSIANRTASYLHTQYVIGYNPTGKAGKDSQRKARVKLIDTPGRDKIKVIARPGYTAPR